MFLDHAKKFMMDFRVNTGPAEGAKTAPPENLQKSGTKVLKKIDIGMQKPP